MCEVFTEAGQIKEIEMDVLRSCVDDEESGQGFLLDSANTVEENGAWYQILWERSCFPVGVVSGTIGVTTDFKNLVNTLYKEMKQLAIAEQFKRGKDAKKMNPILWAVGLICGTFIIIAGMAWLQNRQATPSTASLRTIFLQAVEQTPPMDIGQIVINVVFVLMGLTALYYIGRWALNKVMKRRLKKGDVTDNEDGESDAVDDDAEPVFARIYDAVKRKKSNLKIKKEDVAEILRNYKTLGREWDYEGRLMYAFRKASEGYVPMEVYFEQSRIYAPAKVHRAIHQPEIEITHDVTVGKTLFEQYGHLLPYGLAIAFIIFMMVSS